jgi:Fe-S-cluster containining protein
MTDPRTKQTITIAGGESVPLQGTDPVALSCGIEGCSSNCCKNGPPIVLNPYEIDLICRASGTSYEDLLDIVETGRAEGFPLVMLPRDPACPFWSGKGCRIYEARPLACRLFPLGRVYEHGTSHIVLPERNACSGLVQSASRTLDDYLREQAAGTPIAMADHWIAFVSDMESLVLPDAPVTSVVFHMLVYSPDTPPDDGGSPVPGSAEDRFLLRLATARRKVPQFLRIRQKL